MPSIMPSVEDLNSMGTKRYTIWRLKVWAGIYIICLIISTVIVRILYK